MHSTGVRYGLRASEAAHPPPADVNCGLAGMVTGAATLTDVLSFKGPQEAPVAHCPPGKNPATKVLAKANALRKWLSVGTDGEASILELAKLRVTHQLGVQLRDLRCVKCWGAGPG